MTTFILRDAIQRLPVRDGMFTCGKLMTARTTRTLDLNASLANNSLLRHALMLLVCVAAVLLSVSAQGEGKLPPPSSWQLQPESSYGLLVAMTTDEPFRNPFLEALEEGDSDVEAEAPPARSEPTGSGGLENLRVYLHDVRAPSIGFTTASINYVIHVGNPNSHDIKSPRLTYEAFIADVGMAVGRTVLPDIPAGGHRHYASGFIVSYIDLGRSLIEAIRNRDFSLRIVGNVHSEGQEVDFVTTVEVRREVQ